MAHPRYEIYQEHKTAAENALTAAGLDRVLVTADALKIESAARDGVVVFPPPDLTFPTFDQYEVTFEAIVIAGPADNLEHAWKKLDEIIEALFQANLNMRDATADSFTPPNARPLPGYLITFNTDTVYKETP